MKIGQYNYGDKVKIDICGTKVSAFITTQTNQYVQAVAQNGHTLDPNWSINDSILLAKVHIKFVSREQKIKTMPVHLISYQDIQRHITECLTSVKVTKASVGICRDYSAIYLQVPKSASNLLSVADFESPNVSFPAITKIHISALSESQEQEIKGIEFTDIDHDSVRLRNAFNSNLISVDSIVSYIRNVLHDKGHTKAIIEASNDEVVIKILGDMNLESNDFLEIPISVNVSIAKLTDAEVLQTNELKSVRSIKETQ